MHIDSDEPHLGQRRASRQDVPGLSGGDVISVKLRSGQRGADLPPQRTSPIGKRRREAARARPPPRHGEGLCGRSWTFRDAKAPRAELRSTRTRTGHLPQSSAGLFVPAAVAGPTDTLDAFQANALDGDGPGWEWRGDCAPGWRFRSPRSPRVVRWPSRRLWRHLWGIWPATGEALRPSCYWPAWEVGRTSGLASFRSCVRTRARVPGTHEKQLRRQHQQSQPP